MASFVYDRTLPENCCVQRNGDIVARHGQQNNCYADDAQMYMRMKQTIPMTEVITKIVPRLAEVTDWYGKNNLS